MKGYDRKLAILPPRESDIVALTYDEDLLDAAVRLKKLHNLSFFPDIETVLNIDYHWQYNCRIWEHVTDYGYDYDKIPKELR